MKPTKTLILITASLLLMPVLSAQAGDKTKTGSLDCATGSLAAAIGKLDRSVSNVLQFSGNCVEDIVIQGHRDLTLIGLNGASITATVTDLSGNLTTALEIFRSNFTIESVTLYSGFYGAWCSDRSNCVFRDVTIVGGWNGLAVQSQSTTDLIGSSSITGSQSTGVGVYGASSFNTRPHWNDGYDYNEPGYEISGHGGTGVVVQDGSFYRSDNAAIVSNRAGVVIKRGAVAKLYGGYILPGISDNLETGVYVHSNSTVDIDTSVKSNGEGLKVGALSSVQVHSGEVGSNAGGDILCDDDTARVAERYGENAVLCPSP